MRGRGGRLDPASPLTRIGPGGCDGGRSRDRQLKAGSPSVPPTMWLEVREPRSGHRRDEARYPDCARMSPNPETDPRPTASLLRRFAAEFLRPYRVAIALGLVGLLLQSILL